MPEAGVAGSEVVEREAGTLLFEFGGDAVGVLGVADESTFGDLEDETVEGEAGLFGGGADVFGEGEIGELGEGDIDREGEVLGIFLAAAKTARRRFPVSRPLRPAASASGMNSSGGIRPRTGMLPAR